MKPETEQLILNGANIVEFTNENLIDTVYEGDGAQYSPTVADLLVCGYISACKEIPGQVMDAVSNVGDRSDIKKGLSASLELWNESSSKFKADTNNVA